MALISLVFVPIAAGLVPVRRGSELPGTLAGAEFYPAARSGRHTGQCILSVLGMKMYCSGQRYHLS